MALKFWLGGARSDKSHRLIEYVVEEAKKNPTVNYLVVAPEQYGLSTQREYVLATDNKGILNIDVLSFLRLAHRISDEVGSYDSTVVTLDDMGKNLILQLLSCEEKDSLEAFSENINKLGTVSKLKSMISEFMQYGIKPDKVDEMIASAKKEGKGLLASKLSDVNLLYRKFLSFIQDRYTTTEETLDRVSSIIYKSETIKNSVIIFDGFTGFTPVQNKLIAKLMEYAKDIHVALLKEDGSDIFALSNQTIDHLEKMAMERQVFVAPTYVGEDATEGKEQRIIVGTNPEEEIGIVASKIRQLVVQGGYRYRDFAIVTGDLDSYRNATARIFEQEKIPFFIDKTQPMLLNPFVEFIRSLIAIYGENYSYEAMFRFLKSGLYSISREDIDRLDNYCLATGVKGSKSWHNIFTKTSKSIGADEVVACEQLRQTIISSLDMFSASLLGEGKVITAASKASVKEFTIALYKMIELNNIEEKLKEMADDFAKKGQRELANEYSQVYVKIMQILEEIVELIPDEKVDVRSFGEIINAGLDSIRIGIAPLGTDYVQVGDLIRSRLSDVKVLFLVGANEGIIPKVSSSSGVINEADREFLINNIEGLQIAPTAREDSFNQRLYLYMAMNKPKEILYLAYSKMTMSGQSMLPSYIVRKAIKENKDIEILHLSGKVLDRIDSKEKAFSELSGLIVEILSGRASSDEVKLAKELITFFKGDIEYSNRLKSIIKDALVSEEMSDNNSIGKAVAHAIYGKRIIGSVTRLESYANCAYQYFLRYGLSLQDREIFSFEASDLGSIFHNSLAEYSNLIQEKGYSWLNVPEEARNKLMEDAVGSVIAKERDAALYSTARTSYMVNRIKRIMQRTAEIVTDQVKAGKFEPQYFELDFDKMGNLDSLSIKLSEEEEMRLKGRIDRVDTCEVDEGIYVKIIDYKSSGKSMDLAAVYEGRQLQLLVYLNAVMENEGKKTQKEILPAGILYYHIEDPIIDGDGTDSEDNIKAQIMDKLKMTGLINGDDNGKAISLMDESLDIGGKSKVLKASRKKDGSLGASKDVVSGEDIELMGKYVQHKICSIGRDILDGNIAIPVVDGVTRFSEPKCEYCSYQSICVNRGIQLDDSNESDGQEGDFIEHPPTGEKLKAEDYLRMMREEVED